jgi:hypothetical protein
MGRFDEYDDDGDIEEEESGAGDRDPGTVLRPMYAGNMVHPDWERDPKRKLKPTWDPTIRWGDKTYIQLGPIDPNATVTADLLNVQNLPKPVVCQVQFHAGIINPDANSRILFTEVELFIGNGSQLQHVRRRFSYLPQSSPTPLADGTLVNVPIDASWTLPMTNIRGRVSVRGTLAKVECALWLTPIFLEKE